MRHNSFQKIYASYIAPNPEMDVLWMDLKSDPYGSAIKFWNGATGTYELISSDASTSGKHVIYADGVELPIRSKLSFNGFDVSESQPADLITISADKKEDLGVAQSIMDLHELEFDHDRIDHQNRDALDMVSGINTGDQDLSWVQESSSNLLNTSNKTIVGAINEILETVNDEVFPENTITSSAFAQLPAGSNVSGKNALEVLDLAINAELFQTAAGITAPSNTFTISPSGLQEVGAILTIVKTRTFDRGAISPQYQSETAFRSGELVDYTEVGNDGTHTVTLGLQSWTSKANYSKGTLIKGSKGTTAAIAGVVNPLPAGSTGVITRTITGVYPVYATTANISIYTKLGLLEHGDDIEVNEMVAETSGAKQSIRIPQAWGTITSLQQFNTLSGQWDNIDLSTFTKTAVQLTINGSTVNYWEYTHNGATIGSRRLKFRL